MIDQLLAVPNGVALLYLIYKVHALETTCKALSGRINGVDCTISKVKKKSNLYLK